MNMKQKQKKNNLPVACLSGRQGRHGGVSILELLTVLAIIVTLVGVTLVEFGRIDDKAQRNGALVSAKAIGSALVMYQADRNNQGYTCAMDRLGYVSPTLPGYVNLTSVKASFTSVEIKTDNCADFNTSFTYLYISGTVKGIQPSYIVNYYILKPPAASGPPEGSNCNELVCCSNGGVTPYPCKDKF